MDEQKTSTSNFIKSLMEPAYTLIWTDYNDNLDNHYGLIQKCPDSKGREHLWEKAGKWYSDTEWEAVRETIAKLKGGCVVFHDFDGEAVGDLFDEYEGGIRDRIYSRNDSDVMKELVGHMDNIPIRVEILSNYDCINSNWFESQGGYRYEESHFRDMVDSLNLNPARIKRTLTERGYRAYGCFLNRKDRNGKEQVSYEQFYKELISSCYGANLLTYIDRVNPKELYKADSSLKEVTIPKGNCCGLFNSTYGGGSLLEMELKRDAKLKLEAKGYRDFRFWLDDEYSKYDCSARHIYGVDDSFLGDAVRIVSW